MKKKNEKQNLWLIKPIFILLAFIGFLSALSKGFAATKPDFRQVASGNSDKLSSLDSEVEELVNQIEANKQRQSEGINSFNNKSVNQTSNQRVKEVLENVQKLQKSQIYQNQINWTQTNKNGPLAKQSQPIPTIDYQIDPQTKESQQIVAQASKERSANTELAAEAKAREKDIITKFLHNYRLNLGSQNDSQISNQQNGLNSLLANQQLLIFVSSAIPKNSLKDLMIQARRANGILVFRGLIGGSLRATQQFLGEIAKENVSAIIDPRLFTSFKIELVPSFVVVAKNAPKLMQDCQEASCDFTPIHDRISGNITLDYALNQMADGDGSAKLQAASILAKISTANHEVDR